MRLALVRPPALALLPALLGALAACSSPGLPVTTGLQPHVLSDIPNLHTQGGVFFAGQPSPEALEAAARAGLAGVLDLRHGAERDWDEAALAASLGLSYHAVPWNGPDQLTDEVFARVDGVLASAPRPLLFHCGSGNRVGAHWLVWRVRHDGLDWDAALAEAREVGLRTPAYEQRAREYLTTTGALPVDG